MKENTLIFPEEAETTGGLIDQAQALNLHLTQEALAWHTQQRALQHQHALERQALGLAGICETCGRPIPAERLAWNPDATRCVKCQEMYEKRCPRGSSLQHNRRNGRKAAKPASGQTRQPNGRARHSSPPACWRKP